MTINIVFDVLNKSIYSMYVSGGNISNKVRKYLEKKISENPENPDDWRITKGSEYWVSPELTSSGYTTQNGLFRDYTFEC